MAIINYSGWEDGAGNEFVAQAGTRSIVTTDVNSGTYAGRCNPAANAAGHFQLTALDAGGIPIGAIGRTLETFYTVWFTPEDIPSGTVVFFSVRNTAGTEVIRADCSSGGAITLVGSTTSATIATIVADTKYRLDVRVTSNGTSAGKIDGGTEQTCTANNVTQDRATVGRTITTQAVAFDFTFDDLFISNTGFPTGGQCTRLDPIGNGNYTGWASGTGTTFAEVDDVPPDTDTTYVAATATGDNTAKTFTMESRATAGVVGAVACVKPYVYSRTESNTGTNNIGSRLRSSSTDSDSGATEFISTAYVPRHTLNETDPATGAAWTGAAVDAIEVGPFAGSIAQVQRCTAVYAMVWSTGVEATGNRRRRVLIGGTP